MAKMEERFSQILKSFLPGVLSERIASDPEHLDRLAEQRWVTVLFADITGFTAMCERLSAEETISILNRLFAMLVDSIRLQGGIVDKFLGDGIMALFGAPVSHPDDPARAIRAAIGMLESVKKFNRSSIARQTHAKLSISVGINTGYAVSGLVGDDQHREYTVIGDPINIAARLEQMAKPGEILIGKSTFERCKHNFQFEYIGELALKGKSELQPAWRVIRESESGQISVEEKLFFHSDRVEQFIHKSIQNKKHLGISGDPVALDYWRRHILSKQKNVLFVQAQSGRGFSVIEAILNKMPAPESIDKEMKTKYIRNLSSLVAQELSQKILVIGHAERIDDGSIAVLEKLTDRCIIWLGESIPLEKAKVLKLSNFSPRELSMLIKQKLGVRSVSKEALEYVWSITHGMPGHVWHLLGFLREGVGIRVVRGSLKIIDKQKLPADLSAHALATLDSLPPKMRDCVVAASVLGDTFPKIVFDQMMETDKSFQPPEEVFLEENDRVTFRWELMRKASYASMTAPTKKRLHLAAANAYKRSILMQKKPIPPELMGKYGVRRAKRTFAQTALETIAPELAYHYEHAGRKREAFKYLLMAGQQQKSLWAYREALDYYRRAEKIAVEIAHRWRSRQRFIDLLFDESELAWITGEHNEALRINRKLAQEAIKLDDKKLLFLAINRTAVIFDDIGKSRYAEILYEHAMRLLDEFPHSEKYRIKLMVNLGAIRANKGKLNEARTIFLNAFSLAKRLSDEVHCAMLLTNLGWIYGRQNRPQRAIKLYWLAAEICRKRGDIRAEAQNLVNMAIAQRDVRDIDSAIKSLRRAEQLFQKLDDMAGLATTLNNLGEFLREAGVGINVLKLHRRALRLAKSVGDNFLLVDILRNIAFDYLTSGDKKMACKYFEDTKKLCQRLGDEELLQELSDAASAALEQ